MGVAVSVEYISIYHVTNRYWYKSHIVSLSANKIISGTILKISDQHITVDIGYKSEGQIPKEEFLSKIY